MMIYDLTVIIPAFNEEERILDCLDSIFESWKRCKGFNVNVVVVNDGSTDETSAVVKESGYSVTLIDIENSGVSLARNKGLDLFADVSEYIAFVDADDTVKECFFENIYKVLVECNPDIIEFDIALKRNYTDSIKLLHSGFGEKELKCVDERYLKSLMQQGNWYPVSRVYKSKLFSEARFSPGRYYEDSILIPLIYCKCESVFSIGLPLYNYIIREGSITQRPTLKHIDDLLYSLFLFKKNVKNESLVVVRKERLFKDVCVVAGRLKLKELVEIAKVIKSVYSDRYVLIRLFFEKLLFEAKFIIKSLLRLLKAVL